MKDIKNIGVDFIKDMNLEQCTQLEKLVALEMLVLCLVELAKVRENIPKFGEVFEKENMKMDELITECAMANVSKFEREIMNCAGYWSNDIEYNLKEALKEKKIDTKLITEKEYGMYDNIYEWLSDEYGLAFGNYECK